MTQSDNFFCFMSRLFFKRVAGPVKFMVKKISQSSKMMFDFAGFGMGELINYINEFTVSFSEKKKLINKLTEFNESRKIIIHRLITSRENVEEKIEEGILKGKEITKLIDEIEYLDYKKIV